MTFKTALPYVAFISVIAFMVYNAINIPFTIFNQKPLYIVILHFTGIVIALWVAMVKIPLLFEEKDSLDAIDQ